MPPCGGRALTYPGLDVNVPTPDHVRQGTPDDIRAAVSAALDGGADGLILSRKYSEMQLDNLSAVATSCAAGASSTPEAHDPFHPFRSTSPPRPLQPQPEHKGVRG